MRLWYWCRGGQKIIKMGRRYVYKDARPFNLPLTPRSQDQAFDLKLGVGEQRFFSCCCLGCLLSRPCGAEWLQWCNRYRKCRSLNHNFRSKAWIHLGISSALVLLYDSQLYPIRASRNLFLTPPAIHFWNFNRRGSVKKATVNKIQSGAKAPQKRRDDVHHTDVVCPIIDL